jgi:hypothetical protein
VYTLALINIPVPSISSQDGQQTASQKDPEARRAIHEE